MKNIYIWKSVEKPTGSYHNQGGCVIIAESLKMARKQLPSNCEAQEKEPDFIAALYASTEDQTFIFPDEGCC